jgi:hypothetical protein
MRQDRFLQGILIFILILVTAALVSYFGFQRGQTYLPDTSPENVSRNYALALQRKDYQKAYGYLQQTEDTPSYQVFQESLLRARPSLAETGLQIVDVSRQGDRAVLDIVLVHGGNGPFGRTWSEEAAALLVLEDQAWKISSFPPPYWGWGWEKPPRPVPAD